MKNNIAVARLWHKLGKYEYFCLKQLIETFPDIQFDFHIVLDQDMHHDEWTAKILDLNLNLKTYSKEFMQSYAKIYDIDLQQYDFNKFIHLYHILIGHYLRRVEMYDYMLTYEYDIIFNTVDLKEVQECLIDRISFGIHEPDNANCDKALLNQICQLYQTDITSILKTNNMNLLGCNAGFQGISLKLFDEFLSKSGFNTMLSIFDFDGIYKKDGTEKWGWERTVFDTQEQSFYSLMNQLYSSEFKILNTDKYFFAPCWDDFDGYIDRAMKSNIVHFTGHVKSTRMFDIIEKSLQNG